MVPSLTALCTGLNSADLASLSQSKDAAGVLAAWTKLAADAPDAIKADMQLVATYLQAAVSHDYTAMSGAMTGFQAAIAHITTYIATNCHA
ncbi:hypothetical protein Back2_25210 [Nocardioides baekrokdamisoli]|uniref:Uncharacterized protein n=2 Tax=Nocardioides baekrokdamisoli TaxID=1804624 RepID=A0A3G9J487_9ACTN|nr:hypothetical protein Back2_25210 [Nocardioides baekrokdamisoli]